MKRREFLVRSGGIMLLLQIGKAALVVAENETTRLLTDRQTLILRRFVYLLFPHENIGNTPYILVVNNVQEKMTTQQVVLQLEAGLNSLDTAREPPWLDLPEQEQVTVMKGLEKTPFFALLYNESMGSLYQNEHVWEVLGYQGSSLEHGGYLSRGFDDINWLPEE